MCKFIKLRRNIFKKVYRLGLKNKNFSVIASNCNGGIIMNDLGVRFNTPTVNLFFFPDDFIKLLLNLEENLKYEVVEYKDNKYNYPIGDLNGIKIHFMHYKTFDEAKIKWDERKKRINFNNLFIMFTDRDGCTYDQIKQFDSLPYKNKVIFTYKPYPEFKSAYYIAGFENEESVGILSEYIANRNRRYLHKFDFVKWFNNEF